MVNVSSDLRLVPPRQRQFLSLLIGPVGLLLLVAGGLLAWRPGAWAGHLIGAVIAVIAVLLLGVAHGLFWSARRDRYEARLDAAVLAAGGGACGSDCDSCTGDDCAVKALPRL
jgi:hypothetical protein